MNIELMRSTTQFFSGDPKRIQHFTKVYTYASLIGQMEELEYENQRILEAAAIVHDTGIKRAEELFGYNNGKLQEQYGPEAARPLLEACGYSGEEISRICYLVSHHHTYSDIDGKDYQILVEADFLVNMYEDGLDMEAVRNAYNRIFVTEYGKKLCRIMYGL